MIIKKKIILLFDSGVGGLSIYHEIKKKLPNFNYIYAFDNLIFPYGNKKKKFIIERTFYFINEIQKKYKVILAIIACNTASILSLSILKKNFHFPIIGVFPEIKIATKKTKNGIIGILATKITINEFFTKKKIEKLKKKYKIITLHSTKLVELAENKFIKKKIQENEIKNILKSYINIKKQPDTILLGCTHFNFIEKEIKRLFNKKIKIIKSGITTIKKAIFLIKKNKESFIKKNNIIYCSKINKKSKNIKKLKKKDFQYLKKI